MRIGKLFLLGLAVLGCICGLPFLFYINQPNVQAELIATVTLTLPAGLPLTPEIIIATVMP